MAYSRSESPATNLHNQIELEVSKSLLRTEQVYLGFIQHKQIEGTVQDNSDIICITYT